MMEPQKDNYNQKDNEALDSQSAGSFNPSVFHNDREIHLLYKKIEAICGAVFLVTNLVPESDIIKDTLRRQCLASLTHAVTLMAPTVNVTAIQSVAADMVHLNSLLDVAFWSGAVSQMNSSIIQNQISKVELMCGALIDKYKNRFFLDPAFFKHDPEPVSPSIPAAPVVKKTAPAEAPAKPFVKKEPEPASAVHKGHTIGQPKGQYIKDTTNANSRRESILKLLGQKSDLGIKDFASVITGYSEKTIQRELLALVDEGVIKKQGERRWSTYSLRS